MVKAILWDNDGVLVDTEELYFSATRDVLSEAGVNLTRDLFIQISLKQGRSTFDLAAEQGLSQEVTTQLRADRNRRYSNLLKGGVRILDGVEDTLRQLHGKVSMGVVTSSRREHFEIIHTTTGLLHYFDFVLTREDYRRSKPDPDPFLAAIKRNGLHRCNTQPLLSVNLVCQTQWKTAGAYCDNHAFVSYVLGKNPLQGHRMLRRMFTGIL